MPWGYVFRCNNHSFLYKSYRLRNGKAEAAYLTVDRLNDGNHFVVKQGVSVGDTIITEGVGLVKEGMIVTPKNVTP